MNINENSLRRLIRSIIFEDVSNYRGGAHAKYFAGGDPAFNIPQIDGVDIDVTRADNNVGNPSYSVTVRVEGNENLNVMQVFKDEEEAKKFARDKAEQIKRDLEFSIS